MNTLGERTKETAHGVGSSVRKSTKNGGKREETVRGESRENSDEGEASWTEEGWDGTDRTDQKACRGHGTNGYVSAKLLFLDYRVSVTQGTSLFSDHRPLPELKRLPGLKLSGQAFADIVMVFEFLHNFGETLGFGRFNCSLVIVVFDLE